MLKALIACFMLATWVIATPPILTLPIYLNGTVNSAFSWQITASNTPSFYTASNLPPGVVLNRQTGLVSGTPKAAGTFIVTVAAANADGSSFAPSGTGATQSMAIIISSPSSPSLASPVPDNTGWTPYLTLPLGTPFSKTITASNTDPTTRYVLSGSLPPGITLQGNIINGTPTQSGLYMAEVGITNLAGFSKLPVIMFVPTSGGSSPLPVLGTPDAVGVNPNDFFECFVPASGDVTDFVAGPLPPGVFLERQRGRIYGSTNQSGNSSIIISARSPSGWAQPVSLSLQVSTAPTFYGGALLSQSTLERGTSVGSISITPSDKPLIPYTYSVSGLPPGLIFQTNSITGTPTQAGFFTPSVTLTDSGGTRLSTAPLVVMNPALEKLSSSTTNTYLALAFGAGRFVRTGAGGLIETSTDNGSTWSATTSGTTTNLTKVTYGGGRFVAVGASVALSSTNGVSWSTLAALPTTETPLAMAASGTGIIILTSSRALTSTDGSTWTNTSPPFGISPAVGVGFYQGSFAIYGNSSTTQVQLSNDGITWATPITLPNNIYVDLGIGKAGSQYLSTTSYGAALQSSPDGTIWTTRSTYSDFSSISDFAYGNGAILILARTYPNYFLIRNPGAWASVVSTLANQSAVRGQPFSLQLSASENPTGFNAYGLPPGVTLNTTTGLIAGTPTLDGSYFVTIASANALGPSRAATVTINVQNDYALPPVVAGGSFTGGQVGKTFSYDPQTAAGLTPGSLLPPSVTFSATGLPPGVSMDTQTGLLSGVPTTAGTYSIDYRLTGQFGETRFRVTARIAPNPWTTQSLGTGSSSSEGIWQAGDRYALELSEGSVVFSPDGQNWSAPVTVGTDGATLNGFAYGAGKYVFSSAGAVYVSTDLATWTRQALPVTTGCQGLIFGAGQFVLAQNYAFAPALLVSPDGVNWTLKPLTLGYPAAPISVAYGNGYFVCTTSYLGPVLLSSDGTTWETITPAPSLNGPVAFSGGRFAIMTGGGATSVDGRSWQFKPSNADSPPSPVAIVPFGQGFLVTAESGTLHASLDGLNWRKLLTLSPSSTLQGLASGPGQATVRYRNGLNVFVNQTPARWLFPTSGPAQFSCLAGTAFQQTFSALPAQTGLIWHAAGLPDGLILSAGGTLSGTPTSEGSYQAQLWAEDALGIYEPLQVSFDVRAATGQAPRLRGLPYLADATLGTSYAATLPLQTDGLNAVTSVTGLPRGLTYDAASRTISGKPLEAGSFNAFLVATDSYGSNQWTLPLRVRNGSLTTTYSAQVLGLAWNGTTYVSVGDTSAGYINISTDGVNWSLSLQNTYDLPLAGLNAVAWAAGKFVAVGNTGTLLTSANGNQWQRVTLGTTANLRGVTYGGGRWVAVGAGGVAVISTDAATWQVIATGATTTFNGIGHDGSAFFAVGDSGTIRKSTDGSTWSAVTSGTTRTLYTLAYGAGRYVVGTTNGDVLVSTNGAAWSSQSLGYTANSISVVRSLIYKTGYGFALNFYDNTTSSNRFLRSADGLSWTASAGYAGNAQSLLVSDSLVLVGDGSQNKIRVFPANAAPEIAAATAAVAYPGVAFYYDVAPWGLTTPLTATGLPSGLILNATTGTISGTAQSEGVYDVETTSSGTQPAHFSLKLSVLAGPPSFITATSGSIELRITRGDAIDWAIPAIHPAESWRSAPGTTALPSGLSFDYTTGRITGAATQSGVFSHQFYATNALGDSFGTLMIYVSDPLPVITRQPAVQSVIAGDAATFSVETSLTSSVRFQWFFNGQPVQENSHVSGTRSSALHLTGTQLADSGSYDVIVSDGKRSALSSPAPLTVQSAGYGAWVEQHSGVLGDGAPLSAPLGDGVSNLMRYALGLPLRAASSADYLTITTRNGLLVLSYVRPAGISDITYSVEGSRNLQTWSTLGVDHHRLPGDTGVEWETWEATYSITSQPKSFLRLRIDQVTP